MKLWLNVREGAEYAGVCRDTIYTACEQDELRHVHVAGRRTIRLRPQWIDAWLERHVVDAQDPHVVNPVPVKAGAGSKVTS
jgi:excisionase family DNA binding protein